jgi:hypothetical protein
MIQEALEDKQRYMFSQNLKDLDGSVDLSEQQQWKKQLAKDFADKNSAVGSSPQLTINEAGDEAQTA